MKQTTIVGLLVIGIVIACLSIASAVLYIFVLDTSEEPTPIPPAFSCLFRPAVDRLPLYDAPFTDPSQQKDTLAGDASYVVLRQTGEHFYVAAAADVTGWVDRRSGTLEGDCAGLPVDNTPLSAYDTLCLFTAADDLPLYNAPDLIISEGNLPAGTHVVTQQTAGSYYIRLDHASGGWVPRSSGEVSGRCDSVPAPDDPDKADIQQATTARDTELWTLPDTIEGEMLTTLEDGVAVTVIGGPLAGVRDMAKGEKGDWYEVQVLDGDTTGWVWAGDLDLEN